MSETKACGKCNETKDLNDFPKNCRSKDGHYSLCKVCDNERKKVYYQNNVERYRQNSLKLKYSYCKNFDEIMDRYYDTHACDCCGRIFGDTGSDKKCIDHTGNYIRGIICRGCNSGIGHLGDSYKGVNSALDYLKRFQNEVLDKGEHSGN